MTKIEWVKNTDGTQGYTINPVKGLCPVACPYCYARRMYLRFKWNPQIRYDDWVWQEGGHIPKGSRIFVGSTIELFGEWVNPAWLQAILAYCRSAPQHTFIFLTKKPGDLPKEFPPNCWVGVSVTDGQQLQPAIQGLIPVSAGVKFLSLEPLLGHIPLGGLAHHLQWVIIGRQTPASSKTAPRIEWIKEIVKAADKAGVPVFLKYNLVGLIPIEEPFYRNDGFSWGIRQEMPKEKK